MGSICGTCQAASAWNLQSDALPTPDAAFQCARCLAEITSPAKSCAPNVSADAEDACSEHLVCMGRLCTAHKIARTGAEHVCGAPAHSHHGQYLVRLEVHCQTVSVASRFFEQKTMVSQQSASVLGGLANVRSTNGMDRD